MSGAKDQPRSPGVPADADAASDASAARAGKSAPDAAQESAEELFFPEDERSPVEGEEDHSSADFDIDAELEKTLGPAEVKDASAALPTADTGISPSLFHQDKEHFDERSPMDWEEDHSSTDFDIEAELEAKLGPMPEEADPREEKPAPPDAAPPPPADIAGSGASPSLFHQDNDHFDERSPMEWEEDHSSTDVDIEAELEAKLGPAGTAPETPSPENTGGDAPSPRVPLVTGGDDADDDQHSPLEPEDTGEDDGANEPQAESSSEAEDGGLPDLAETAATAVGTPPSDDEEEEDEEDEDDEDDDEAEATDADDRPMTLRDHLNELRKRVFRAFVCSIVGFFACYPFAKEISKLLLGPLNKKMPAGQFFIYTQPAEAFFAELKIAFVAGLFATSPLIFYQLWAFIAPGLYKEEKLYIIPIALFSAIFFISGGAFCYYVVFPFAFEFFMSYNSEFLQSMLKISESLGFVLQLLLAFGLVFELPLFIFFLARLGIVTADMLRRFRRYAVLVMFIIAALLTPPDVLSQLLMAGPLLILYESSILIAVVFGRKKPKPDEEEKDDDEDEDKEKALSA